MNWDETWERLEEVFADAAETVKNIAEEVDAALRTMEALEWERDRWKDPKPACPSRREALPDRLNPMLSAAMRDHTAVTGQ